MDKIAHDQIFAAFEMITRMLCILNAMPLTESQHDEAEELAAQIEPSALARVRAARHADHTARDNAAALRVAESVNGGSS